MLNYHPGDNRAAIYEWIASQVPRGGRVLDIGCGEGDLLAHLAEKQEVRGTGIELDEASVLRAAERGLAVHHGDVEEGLDHYGDDSFDIAILSLTIQELTDTRGVIREAFRVGKQAIVVFPNFGHWTCRLQLLSGRAPRTPYLPYDWYDSPNRHFFTISDWEEFCRIEGWLIRDKAYLKGTGRLRFLPNLRADVAMYRMRKPSED